ncbi:MAG: hypothetical protein J5542_07035 [Bacteroidales bacterium]|nr:hypothetical protein [Bacteroidales bacterium]
MFESIKTRLANRRLQKARGGETRRVRACGLELANKIGILYDATDEAQFEVVRRLLFKLKNTIPLVKALGYVDSEELSDFHIQPLEFSFFCHKDLDRLGFPSEEAIAEFCNADFDILLCLDIEEKIPLSYVKLRSKAGFKVGLYNEKNSDLLDVMISLDEENSSVEELVKQVMHYLENIKYE